MIRKNLLKIILLTLVLLSITSKASAYENKALILYDSNDPRYFPPHEKTLANLMGHFDLPYELKTVDEYQASDTERYRATFYIGNAWDRQNSADGTLPYDFLNDVVTTNRPITWINFNLWKIAWNSNFSQKFEQKYGFRYLYTADSFPTVTYKGQTFRRRVDPYYGDPIAKIQILNSSIAKVDATASNSTETIPYIVKANNFTFVADNTLELWYEDEPYIAFGDHLHDQLQINHAEQHRALVRIEDVDATDDPAKLRVIADYLSSKLVPFTVAVIPKFVNPQLNNNPPGPTIEIELRNYTESEKQQDPLKKNASDVADAIKYMQTKGGTVAMHGFTHQYDSVANPWNGISGDDVEFYVWQDGRPISPVPEDSISWVQDRINQGLGILNSAGFGRPNFWVTPHYEASELDQGVFASNFSAVYQRFPDSYYPYIINKTVYGNKLIPENLGYFYNGSVSAQTIVDRAQKNLVVRDGFASFFFHPRRVKKAVGKAKKYFQGYDLGGLDTAVNGIKSKGYTFVSVNSL